MQMPNRQCARAALTLAAVLLTLASGCAGLGQQLHHAPLPPGAPEVDTIIDDLATNDRPIQNFRAAGTFTIESPDLKAVEKFYHGMIAYRKPGELHVQGSLKIGFTAFRLVSVGSEFLIEFPGKRDPAERYFYRLEGEKLESIPFSVSPAVVAKEMFTPVDWLTYDRNRVRMVAYDPDAQTAVLELGRRRHPERCLTVRGIPWVVIRNERLDDSGAVIADTTLDDYHEVDGVWFPAFVDAWFPSEATRMTFEMRNIRINTEQVTDDLFTIKWRPTDVEQPLADDTRGNRGVLKP